MKTKNPQNSSNSSSVLSIFRSSSVSSHSGIESSNGSSVNDAFGSTTSLDRKKQKYGKVQSIQSNLEPISDVQIQRTLSLDRRKLQYSPYGSSNAVALLSNDKRKKHKEGKYEKNYKGGSSLSMQESSEKSYKSSLRPRTSHPNLNPGDYQSKNSSHFKEYERNISTNGRFGARSSHQNSLKSYPHSDKESAEESYNDKRRSRSTRRHTSRESHQYSNDNLDKLWSFETGVMWSRTLNSKRIGYILFGCNHLQLPSHIEGFPSRFKMTYKFAPQAESKLIRLVLEAHGLKEVDSTSDKFNIYWSNTHFNPNEIRVLQDWQKMNHFPRSSELTRKDRLYMNIKRMQRQFGMKLYDFIPTSFVLPTEYREFCDTHLRERGTWIVKPVASSQGKGIYLISQVDQISPDETSLISRYIESPLLVDGYKCDLRLYVAVTSLDPLIVYLYDEGLVRLATVKYQQKKNLWNPCIHLTNYSVNKFHSNYQHNQDADKDNEGSKWSLSAFLSYLKDKGVDTATLMRNIEDVIIKSLLAASYQMNTATSMFVPHARNCFELYGFDILIDEQLKPWILEVNLSPSLNIDQPLDLKIKVSMISDLFSLAGVLICNPSTTRIAARPSIYRKLPNLRYSTESYEKQCRYSAPAASMEELKLVRQIMEENERRGGWVRIFPTPDSWATYGALQEYNSPMNIIVHTHLFPEVQRVSRHRVVRSVSSSSTGTTNFMERLSLYEKPSDKSLSVLRETMGFSSKRQKHEKLSTEDAEEVKQSMLEALENGIQLSKFQARMAFSVYLQYIQRRLMIGSDQEKQTDLVYKFLRSATRTLSLPITVQSPSKNLPEEARAVVISKQLGDFIMAYTKDTQISGDTDADKKATHCELPTEEREKEKRSDGEYSTKESKYSSRYSVNSSHNDVTPSDVKDPLGEAILGEKNTEERSDDADSGVMTNDESATGDTLAVVTESNTVTMELYKSFMSAAKEADLEEILALQTKLHNSAGVFLDSARKSFSTSRHNSVSRARTPTSSPQGSPRRGRRSPSVSGSSQKNTDPVTGPSQKHMEPVTSEPSSCTGTSTTVETSSEGTSKQSSCCLFSNILRASLQGTSTSFNV